MLQPTWNELVGSRCVRPLAFGIVGAPWLGTEADKHQTEPESNRPDGP
jgi:hypothetical protein